MMRLDRLVSEFATRAPDKIAVDGGGEVLTYGELDALAHRFANLFRANGVRPGDRVGVHLPRSGRGIAAMLGAMRASAVYVPLDPGSPPARMKLIASDCGLAHVVIAPHLLSAWLAAGVWEPVEHFYLSHEAPVPSAPESARVHAWSEVGASSASPIFADDVSRDSLAYILYTSGSTGTPKGVMLSHRNALSFVDWTAEQIALGEDDRVASVAPFHFDLSVFDVWASLSRGASIVIVDETTVTSGRRMLDRIHEKAITVWYSVPSALILMLENGGLEERRAPSLRAVFFAGEVFPIKYLVRSMDAIAGARFLNLFGPTETNVCTAFEVKEKPSLDSSAIPIGYPSCGDSCLIVDESGRPVPDGEKGELVVEGPTVMLGYWDGGRRTAAKIPYPTGDVVSRRPDGALMYHGRRDHMVKIHGFRVELGEVESAVLAHPGVKEAIAMAVDQRLVVVAIPRDLEMSVLDLKRHCTTRLPRYMVPSEVRIVDALPRTSSGKIDRVLTRSAVVAGDTTVLRPARGDSPGKDR